MNLNDIAFPALVIADDGWVEYLETGQGFSLWTSAAISKYRKRRVLFYDSKNQIWEIEKIGVQKGRLSFFVARLLNSPMPVDIALRPVGESAEPVKTVLNAAIDADDDILTQFVDHERLKHSIQQANSFQSLVRVLKAKRAIRAITTKKINTKTGPSLFD